MPPDRLLIALFQVMEHMDGGSLFSLLHPTFEEGQPPDAKPPVLLSGLTLVQLMRDCAEGLAFLHSIGIIHRDLKSANLLLNRERHHLKVRGPFAHPPAYANSPRPLLARPFTRLISPSAHLAPTLPSCLVGLRLRPLA